MKRKPNPRKAELRAAAGREREAFFAAGGTPVMWNGGRVWTAKDAKKEASRKACRQPVD